MPGVTAARAGRNNTALPIPPSLRGVFASGATAASAGVRRPQRLHPAAERTHHAPCSRNQPVRSPPPTRLVASSCVPGPHVTEGPVQCTSAAVTKPSTATFLVHRRPRPMARAYHGPLSGAGLAHGPRVLRKRAAFQGRWGHGYDTGVFGWCCRALLVGCAGDALSTLSLQDDQGALSINLAPGRAGDDLRPALSRGRRRCSSAGATGSRSTTTAPSLQKSPVATARSL